MNRLCWKTMSLLLHSQWKKVGDSTALNSLADLTTQIPEPFVPHPWATPKALPLVTDSTPVRGPSAKGEDQEIYKTEETS